MKRSALKCYWAFVPLAYKVGMILSALVICGVGILFYYGLGLGSVIILGPLFLFLVGLVDYVAFSGVFSKKIKAMDFMKSSVYGPELVKKTLITDMIVKTLIFFIGCAGIGIVAVIDGTFWLVMAEVFLLYMAAAFYTLIFTRKYGTSIQMQILILYLGIHLASGLMALYMFITVGAPEIGMSAALYRILSMVVILAFAVSGGYLLCKDGTAGFKNGYKD